MTDLSIIYSVTDLPGLADYGTPDMTVEVSSFGGLHLQPSGSYLGGISDNSPLAVARYLRQNLARRHQPVYRNGRSHYDEGTPILSAETIGAQLKARLPLTAEQLLADPAFRKAARPVAEKGKSFSADLLAWEKKAVVKEAVAVLRAEVEAERRAKAASEAALVAERKARLERERPTRTAVLAAYDRCGYRTCKQDHTTTVVIGGTPGVTADTCKGERYSSRCTFRKTESTHTITVAEDWLATVAAHDLAVVDGLLTLSASPVPGKGAALFAAVWVEQAQGTGLKRVSGYIAREGEVSYHAATAKAALLGVRRKARGPAPKRTMDLERVQRRYGGLPVTFDDSLVVGNCASGTRNWCHAVGIDPESTTTLAAVLVGYRLRPLAEVLKVVRRVVRDQRNRQRQVVDPVALGLQVAVAGGDAVAVAVLRDRQLESGDLSE